MDSAAAEAGLGGEAGVAVGRVGEGLVSTLFRLASSAFALNALAGNSSGSSFLRSRNSGAGVGVYTGLGAGAGTEVGGGAGTTNGPSSSFVDFILSGSLLVWSPSSEMSFSLLRRREESEDVIESVEGSSIVAKANADSVNSVA